MDWDRFAAAYDWQLPLERTALVAAIALAEPHPEDLWLDIGTGTGGLLRELARRPGRPHRTIGADASAAMLAKVPPLPEGWSLTATDARQLPFADDAVSIVTAAYLLHVVEPTARRQIIRECHRVLRPAGRLVVVTPAWPRSRIGRLLYAPLAAAAGASVGPAAGLRPLDPSPDLQEAMFTVTARRHIARGYPSLCVSATR